MLIILVTHTLRAELPQTKSHPRKLRALARQSTPTVFRCWATGRFSLGRETCPIGIHTLNPCAQRVSKAKHAGTSVILQVSALMQECISVHEGCRPFVP